MSPYTVAVLVGSLRREYFNLKLAKALAGMAPEYDRSIPGVLKNAIDRASRPYGLSAWGGKPAGVVGVSVDALGTALAQQQLRSVLSYLNVPTMGQQEIPSSVDGGRS